MNPKNLIVNDSCENVLPQIDDKSVDLLLTDIPYDALNRQSNGIRNLDYGAADVLTFDLDAFLENVYRITRGTIIIFCGKEQLSHIHAFFDAKQSDGKGTVRQLVWEKTNPLPMNGDSVYLSSVENAVWFRRSGATFNAHCKSCVFRHPIQRDRIHPTEKSHSLLAELILDNSNPGDLVFDPCFGSGSTLFVARNNLRAVGGIELNEDFYKAAVSRLDSVFDFVD